jgi:hypothetical protein
MQLTIFEQNELQQCEAIIEQGLRTFVDVGAALLKIRDSKLYRQDYSTFEEYCNDRWKFSDRRARMYIDASKAIGNLQSGTTVPVLPTNERQARPLTKLEPEDQVKAWHKVIESAPEGKITANDRSL